MDVTVRNGIKEDLPFVLTLIRELAVYENAPKEVTVTLAELEKDGFESCPFYNFYVAEADNEIIGLAFFYFKYSTWKGKAIYLEDLIVTEKYRRFGVGKMLFDKVVQYCKENKAKRLEWQVLNWNQPAIDFYKKLDAVLDDEWINGELTEEQIQQFSFSK